MRCAASSDPTAHAEMEAIRAAAAKLGASRLDECTLWVTLEPCAMCAAAIALARFKALRFAAEDPKGGGVVHGARIFSPADLPSSARRARRDRRSGIGGAVARAFSPSGARPRGRGSGGSRPGGWRRAWSRCRRDCRAARSRHSRLVAIRALATPCAARKAATAVARFCDSARLSRGCRSCRCGRGRRQSSGCGSSPCARSSLSVASNCGFTVELPVSKVRAAGMRISEAVADADHVEPDPAVCAPELAFGARDIIVGGGRRRAARIFAARNFAARALLPPITSPCEIAGAQAERRERGRPATGGGGGQPVEHPASGEDRPRTGPAQSGGESTHAKSPRELE